MLGSHNILPCLGTLCDEYVVLSWSPEDRLWRYTVLVRPELLTSVMGAKVLSLGRKGDSLLRILKSRPL